MSSERLRLLLGKSRWRRRRALPRDWLAGVDPTGRPTFLYLTDTWRKRAVVEREFRDRGCFAPPVRVLGELFHELWLRHGDGRAILSARSEAVLAERLVRANPRRWPTLEALGRPRAIGEALAHLAHQIDEAGLRELPADVRDRAELTDALDALRAASRGLQGRIPRAASVRGLLAVLERPPPALLDWLRRSHSVIVDDVLQPSALRTAALVALCRAWSTAGAHVVFSLASGRDLGGREAGFFFEYDEDQGYPLKPFAATRTLRRRLFDAWVASGEAGIYVAGTDRVVRVDPWTDAAPDGCVDLTDYVYGAEPLPAATRDEARAWLRGRVRLVRAPTPNDELQYIARSVRAALDAGAAPGDCVVAWPGLETEAATVRSVFADFGVPIALGAGEPAADRPAPRALLELVALPLERWPADRLLALADLCAWELAVPPGELAGWCRAAGVSGGHPRAWFGPVEGLLRRTGRSERLRALGSTLDSLSERCELLDVLTHPRPPYEWRQVLLEAARGVGIDELASRHDSGLLAWGAALRAVEELVIDLGAIETGPWPAADLADHLTRAVTAARWHAEPADADRVQVVGVLELRGLSPSHTWLGGLVRGRFPRSMAGSALLDSALARQLDPVDALSEARYLLHAALRNALDDPADRSLVLSWSHSEAERPLAPSPVLADLLATPTTHPDGLDLGALVVEETPDPGPPWSRSEVERARSPGEVTRAPSHLGRLERPPPAPDSLSVTALETLTRCPARYWYDRVLGLGVEDPWAPELEPRRRGTAIHRILQRFVEATDRASLAGRDREPLARLLHEVAARELDLVEAEGGFDPALQAWARSRWLSGLIDDRPAGVLAAWLDLERQRQDPWTPIAVERDFRDLPVGSLRVRGQLDRLDRHSSGALVVTDYKTGSAPAAVQVLEGLALQPLVYAEAARRDAPDQPVAAAYLTLARADDVRHRAWTGDPGALDVLVDPPLRRHAAALPAPERRRLLEQAADHAQTALAGHFRTTTLGPSRGGCEGCDYSRICRVDHAAAVLDPGADT